jgi:hypothetical protein
MINGAQRPELARSCQPQRQHNMFRSAIKKTLWKAVSSAQDAVNASTLLNRTG